MGKQASINEIVRSDYHARTRTHTSWPRSWRASALLPWHRWQGGTCWLATSGAFSPNECNVVHVLVRARAKEIAFEVPEEAKLCSAPAHLTVGFCAKPGDAEEALRSCENLSQGAWGGWCVVPDGVVFYLLCFIRPIFYILSSLFLPFLFFILYFYFFIFIFIFIFVFEFSTPTRGERVGGGDFPKLAHRHHSRRSWPCDEARTGRAASPR